VRIHYQRTDDAYDRWGLWLWDDVRSPSSPWPSGAQPFTGRDAFGAWADVPLAAHPRKIGFLIIDRTTGDKEGGNKGAILQAGISHLYVKEGDDRVYLSPELRVTPALQAATVIGTGTVRVLIADAAALGDASPAPGLALTDVHGRTVPVTEVIASGPDTFVVKGEFALASDTPLTVSYEGKSVTAPLAWQVIDELYAYDGNDLGCIWHHGQAHLALWAPLATRVDLIVFDRHDQTREVGRMPLTRTDRGVWRAVVIPGALRPPGPPAPEPAAAPRGGLPEGQGAHPDGNLGSPATSLASPTDPAGLNTAMAPAPAFDSSSLGTATTSAPPGSEALALGSAVPPTANATPPSHQADQGHSSTGDNRPSAVEPPAPPSPPPPPPPPPPADIRGYFYQFEVTNPGRPPKRVLDPYARSMAPVTVDPTGASPGPSGDWVGKAAFVDPDAIGPEPSPARLEGYAKREDAIIYEVHVRDFTSDPNIAGELKARWGSFAAFRERLGYLKDLGVTHIQLLPVMAWYFGDETRMHERELEWSTRGNQYNWGYDPQSYFSLDGAYSERPEDPELRIAEFKELVDAIHAAGMGVILDVVYTHMAKADFLDDIVPDYFFFKDPRGTLLGDFGNNLATNRKMAAKLITDSVAYWFRQYKIDGMRWDMMGDATRDAVEQAYAVAAAINPRALFLGEGWRTFKGHLEDPALAGLGADQDWMAHTDRVGVFSDEFRNELKSGFGCEGQPRFLTGGPRDLGRLFNALKAQPSNTPSTAPGDMVQYIEAHDNLTLHDVIAQAIRKDPEVPAHQLEIQRRIRLGNAMVLLAQGTAFLHAGQEWGRTKQWLGPGRPEQKFHTFVDAAGQPFRHPYFIYDSYDSSDAVNRFDWTRATDAARFPEQATTRAFTRGLIALRRSSDAFRLGSKEQVDRQVIRLEAPELAAEDLVLAWRCTATTGETYRIFVNADTRPRSLTPPASDLPAGHDVVVDATRAGTAPLEAPAGFTIEGSTITLDPLTVVIFRR
jgi:pullulanase/glycogen debranching enzyme